jgi:hypothetical protein
MLRISGGDGGNSNCNTMPPRTQEVDFLFFALLVRLLTMQGDKLFGASFSLEQKDKLPLPATTMLGAVLLNASPHTLNGAIPSLHSWHEKQCLSFFVELLVWLQHWHCHKATRVVADLSALAILRGQNWKKEINGVSAGLCLHPQ